MTDHELLTADDVLLMQGLAQRVVALGPELINADNSFGGLAWNWGQGHAEFGDSWWRRLWFAGDELVAWGWARMPRQVRRADGSVQDVAVADLGYQVHPGHAELLDEVIGWYDGVAAGLERTVVPTDADTYALTRWAAHGYSEDPSAEGDSGEWHQGNARPLTDLRTPVLPDGFRFRTADRVSAEAVVRAHVDAWHPSSYTAQRYEGVRGTAAYRPDLHVLVEGPDGVMVASTIMWLDEVNRTAEFEPVGTHRDYRRQGLSTAMLWHGMHLARAAGATTMTVACLGAPGHPGAKGLYYGVGFREYQRDVLLTKQAT